MSTSTVVMPHRFIRAEYPYDDCRVCQLPERNLRFHLTAEALLPIPDFTEPARQLDLMPAS